MAYPGFADSVGGAKGFRWESEPVSCDRLHEQAICPLPPSKSIDHPKGPAVTVKPYMWTPLKMVTHRLWTPFSPPELFLLGLNLYNVDTSLFWTVDAFS